MNTTYELTTMRALYVARAARGILLALLVPLLVTGCDWYGQDEIALRALPYPYGAGVAFDEGGAPDCLSERGVRFVFDGEEVGTAGQDAACSLVDRGRQLWESLAFLYSRREWRASSYFANRLFESGESGGAYTYKVYAGSISDLPNRMPQDVVEQIVDAVAYELAAKSGVMIIAGPAPGQTGAREAVAHQLRAAHLDGRILNVGRDRLLAYAFIHRFLKWEASRTDEGVTIRISAVSDGAAVEWIPTAEELEGVTFYTPDPERTRVLLGNEMVLEVGVNPPDRTRRGSVTIRSAATPADAAASDTARPTPNGTST